MGPHSGNGVKCAFSQRFGDGDGSCRLAALETHRQSDGVAAGTVAEHIAGHQPGAGDEDVVLAAVEFEAKSQGVEAVETELPPLLPQVFGSGPFQHVAKGPVQQGPVPQGGAAAQVKPEVFRIGLTADALGGAGEALQMLVGVAQLGIDVLGGGEEFIVQHQ